MSIIFLIYGLFIGSFLNVCAYRIPEGISIVTPPSSCGSCGHRLNYYDMIPVFNYILNRGKCRYCGSPYSVQYPAVELLTGVLFAMVYRVYGLSMESVLFCTIICIFIVISLIDYKYKIIPDGIIVFGFAATLVIHIIMRDNLFDKAIGTVIGLGVFWLIAVTTDAMGGGDIKLMALVGFVFGVRGVIFITLASFIIGAVVSVGLIVFKIKGRKDEIPFGPFISVAGLLCIFCSDAVIGWYMRFIV